MFIRFLFHGPLPVTGSFCTHMHTSVFNWRLEWGAMCTSKVTLTLFCFLLISSSLPLKVSMLVLGLQILAIVVSVHLQLFILHLGRYCAPFWVLWLGMSLGLSWGNCSIHLSCFSFSKNCCHALSIVRGSNHCFISSLLFLSLHYFHPP